MLNQSKKEIIFSIYILKSKEDYSIQDKRNKLVDFDWNEMNEYVFTDYLDSSKHKNKN